LLLLRRYKLLRRRMAISPIVDNFGIPEGI
jgi:hypothetical protein